MPYGSDTIEAAPRVAGGYGKDPLADAPPAAGEGQGEASAKPGSSWLEKLGARSEDVPFPYDKPNTTYGTVLPIARDEKTGETSLAVPEMIRAPLRGMSDWGADLMGWGRPVGTKQPTEDEVNALVSLTGAKAGGVKSVASPTKDEPAIGRTGFSTPFSRETSPSALHDQAVKIVTRRLDQDAEGGPMTAQQAIERVNKANAEGKPMTLADTGENARSLAGNVARQPGPARNHMRQFLDDRDKGAGERLTGDIEKHIATGSMRQTAQELIKSRSEEARPVWDKAMAGGSIAPLESQLRDSVQAATGAKGTISKEIAQIERDQPGALAARGAAGSETRARYMQLHKDLDQAEKDRLAALEVFKRAKADGETNAPGAVWNPRIQQFLDDPVIKQGIRRGMVTQRIESLASGKKFDPTEYAIVGEGEDGPIVGKVPNMKLLHSAKEGLDEILEGKKARDPNTGALTKYGRAVDQARRSLLNELDAVNPDYKVARAQWGGKSQSMDAMKAGRAIFKDRSESGKLFTHSPEEIAEEFGKLSPGDKEFYRLGVADAIRERVMKTGIGGDEAKAVIKSPWMKQKLRAIFDSDEKFNKFVDAVTAEGEMFETKRKVLGGSDTAARMAEDNNAGLAAEAMRGGAHVATGNLLGALTSAYRLKRDLGLRQNPALNLEISHILTAANPHLSPASLVKRPAQNALAQMTGRAAGRAAVPATTPPPQNQ